MVLGYTDWRSGVFSGHMAARVTKDAPFAEDERVADLIRERPEPVEPPKGDLPPQIADAFAEHERKGWEIAAIVLHPMDVDLLRDMKGVFDPFDPAICKALRDGQSVADTRMMGWPSGMMWGATVYGDVRVPRGHIRVYTALTSDHCLRLDGAEDKNPERARYREWISGVTDA